MRETAACALEHAPAFHDLGDAVALQLLARLFVPGICQKTRTALAFDRFQRLGDAGLQTHQVLTHLGRRQLISHRRCGCLAHQSAY